MAVNSFFVSQVDAIQESAVQIVAKLLGGDDKIEVKICYDQTE